MAHRVNRVVAAVWDLVDSVPLLVKPGLLERELGEGKKAPQGANGNLKQASKPLVRQAPHPDFPGWTHANGKLQPPGKGYRIQLTATLRKE